MVIGKRNTLNGVGLIPLGWLPPLRGLASLGVTPESSGVNYGGRLLDRFVLRFLRDTIDEDTREY